MFMRCLLLLTTVYGTAANRSIVAATTTYYSYLRTRTGEPQAIAAHSDSGRARSQTSVAERRSCKLPPTTLALPQHSAAL